MLEQNALISVPPIPAASNTDSRIATMLREPGSGALGGLQVVPVLGDNMEPTLRRGDFVFVAPARTYQGEGIYATHDPFGTIVLHRFDSAGRGGIRVWSDSPLYSRYEISLSDFLDCVVGKVVITAKVVDRRLLPDALRI